MPADYPNSIKAFTTKTDGVDDVEAAHINDIQLEIEAVETELGVTPKGAHASVAARLDARDTELGANPSGDYASVADRLTASDQMLPQLAQGRLTLSSGTPVTNYDVLAAATLYYTPFTGNRISLFDGVRWKTHAFSERSISLAGLVANKNYDVFIYDNAGSLVLDLAAWNTDTTRVVSLALQDGLYVKSGDLSQRYLGTIRASANGQCEDSQVKRFVWNYYNRVPLGLHKAMSGLNYTYAVAVWRQANNDPANKLEWVSGFPEMVGSFEYAVEARGTGYIAIGVDKTITYDRNTRTSFGGLTIFQSIKTSIMGYSIPVGYRYAAPLEYASPSCDFGAGSPQAYFSGLIQG